MRVMVSVTFDPADGEKMAPLIPAEQARVGELMQAGSLEALYIGTQGSAWIVMRGADEAAIQHDLESLPLHA